MTHQPRPFSADPWTRHRTQRASEVGDPGMADQRGNGGGGRGGGQGGGRSGGRSNRGFAAMDEAQQREIARKGGEASARSQARDEDGQFAGNKSGPGGS